MSQNMDFKRLVDFYCNITLVIYWSTDIVTYNNFFFQNIHKWGLFLVVRLESYSVTEQINFCRQNGICYNKYLAASQIHALWYQVSLGYVEW